MFTTRLLAIAMLAASAILPALAAHAQTLTTLYSFKARADGGDPAAGLLYEAGTLYGTTYGGGSTNCESGCGTVFKLTP